jgi:hypothetical protein
MYKFTPAAKQIRLMIVFAAIRCCDELAALCGLGHVFVLPLMSFTSVKNHTFSTLSGAMQPMSDRHAPMRRALISND